MRSRKEKAMKKKNYFFNAFVLSCLIVTVFVQTDLIAQCDVWVVAATPDADVNINLVISELNKKGITPVRAGNITQLRDNVINILDENGCCLQNLYIVGHGSPGTISLNGFSTGQSESISEKNEAMWKNPLSEVLNESCSGDKNIYLFGCNVGARCDGSNLLFKMAKQLGALIKAPIDRVVEEDIFSNKLSDYLDYGRWQQASNSYSIPPMCIDSLNQKQLRERKKAIERMWYCPCNGQVYSSEQNCKASCPSGLGCFTSYTCEFAYKNNSFERSLFEPVLGRDYWVSPGTNKNLPPDYDQHKKYWKINSTSSKLNVLRVVANWTIGVSQPSLIKESDGYKMWFMGWDEYNMWRIGYATSHYGFDWTEYSNNPVLGEGISGSWDDDGVYSPCVIKDGNTYKMWYTGYSGVDKLARIGYATSPDGINWIKHPTPVLGEGSSGTWESDGVGAPSVIKDGTTYKMWYEGSDVDWWWRIGYAESFDGINWTKYSNNPVLNEGEEGDWDEWGLGAPTVVKDATIFHMWYSGIDGNNLARIGYAISQDGYQWTKSSENPVVDKGYGESWNNIDVSHPAVVINDNEHIFELWYRGMNDQLNYGIGYATAASGSFPVGIKARYHQKQFLKTSVLFQNFPNPFNPTTYIEFRTANSGFVTLKIYDVLGREIAVAVNEEKPAGEYKVEFNGSGLSSGVYFYRIQAGNFTDTKKFILLK